MKDWDKGGLGLKPVLDFIGVSYEDEQINIDDYLKKKEGE